MITFKVKPDDADEYEVTADTRDLYVWEKNHKKQKTFQTLMNDLAMVDMYDIAWRASKRQGLFDGDLAKFANSCVFEFDIDEDEEDPTRSAASDAD